MVNVEGDSVGAGIVAHLARDQLRETAKGTGDSDKSRVPTPPPDYKFIKQNGYKKGVDNNGVYLEEDGTISTVL